MNRAFRYAARQLTAFFDATLAPPDCAACGELIGFRWPSPWNSGPSPTGTPRDATSEALNAAFCAACRPSPASLRERVSGLQCLALGRHEGALRAAVHALKYRSRADLAPRLGQCLGSLCQSLCAGGSEFALVPIPLHPLRLAERGYNQSALLARSAASSATSLSELRFRVHPVALARTQSGEAQATLSGTQRRKNQLNAFRVRALPRHPVILVDDVCTTGATARAAAMALEAHGALVLGLATVTLAGDGSGDAPLPSNVR